MLPEDQEVVSKTLEKTHGMFLVTGPTGSGKTTTLYTILGLLNRADVNILTIEDPVENKIARVNQIQVNSSIDLTFANGLRSILRQDPDIVMVGEIRDHETAAIAVNAAMTGHLVFSSVHANTSAGAVPRMIDLGVEPFLLASTLNMVVAQRLVRVLCPNCKQKSPLTHAIKKTVEELGGELSKETKKMLTTNYTPKGCGHCFNTGYKGRIGIFETLRITEKISKLVSEKTTSDEIWKAAREDKTKSMVEDGIIKVTKGLTTIEEVLRVISV
jgi:type IV pilus assembly protein PilB